MDRRRVYLAVLVVTAVALLVILGLGSDGPDTRQTTFDEGPENWTVTGDAQGSAITPDYISEGGNPGGYMQADDDVTGDVWY